YTLLDNGEVVEEEERIGVVIDEVSNSSLAFVVESKVVTFQEEMPKKSYASIVKVMKDNTSASIPACVPSKLTPIKI
uniref:Uncharacterized protein n=1 Tax=Musa acuminata subsp. malaccensis TaxID=214687 RepID=A0A804L5Z9_MUSAM